MGGEFAGKHVPFGTTFAIGKWLIVRTTTPESTILWDFQHAAPGIVAVPGPGQRTSFGEIKVSSDTWGVGVSLHVAKYTTDATSMTQALFRNVITF